MFPQKKIFKRLNKCLAKNIIRLQINGNSQLILWAYWPRGYEVMQASGLKGIRVFDADHNIVDDPNIPKEKRDFRKSYLTKIVSSVDVAISSTCSMNNWMKQINLAYIYRLRNGVDLDRFTQSFNTLPNSRPVIGYCGTLSRWIDYDIFEALVINNPNWLFKIIGSPYLCDEWLRLKKYDNLFFLGALGPEDVVVEMATFDVAINLYKRQPALDVDSMKLYEYLAAGIPVVSTLYHGRLLEDFDNVIVVADSIDSLQDKIKSAIDKGKSDYTAFLKKQTWQQRVNEFILSLNNKDWKN
jgi:glycosyltransferase involved in cell wall biosynthesis